MIVENHLARDAKRKERLAENELLFRALNQRIEEVADSRDDATMSAVCECGDAHCFAPISLPLAEYERIVRDSPSGSRFVVKPGHEIPDVETVVERHDKYTVVEKPADVIAAADS
jgi:hypothetical protein